MRVLAGDIGGTNARLAIVEVSGKVARIERLQRYASEQASSLVAIVQRFMSEVRVPPVRACFGVACRVVQGVCRSANLPWTIDECELAATIGIGSISIINDFDAIGHGLPFLEKGDVETLQLGQPVAHEPIAIIGAGTGLGEAMLIWDGTRYLVKPSEGGHVNFAARNEVEWGLYRALRAEFEHVSYERVVSGPGLIRIYQYLVGTRGHENNIVRSEMKRDDPSAVIVRHGTAGSDSLCEEAVNVFTSLLGAQAGNLALTVLALGGVYVAGGIAPRMVTKLRTGPFLPSFGDKGRLSPFVARVPVHVIMNANVGLLGAAGFAAAHLLTAED